MPWSPPTTPAEREHYRIERELADRLRVAPRDQRAALYGEVYDELFRLVRDHPQRTKNPQARLKEAEGAWSLVRRFVGPDRCILEVGAGDFVFAALAAEHARRVIAVEVSEMVASDVERPSNLDVVISDGVDIPVPPASVDLVFSDQLIEHLHPEDARVHVANVFRALRPGGSYVCITPNRLSGPHDISRHFDDQPTGLHLREYSSTELRSLFREAGFRRVRFYFGRRGSYFESPWPLVAVAEWLLDVLPSSIQRRFRCSLWTYVLFGVNAVATR